MTKSDYKVKIHHVPLNTTTIKSDEYQACRTTHAIFVLTNKEDKMTYSYFYGPIFQWWTTHASLWGKQG